MIRTCDSLPIAASQSRHAIRRACITGIPNSTAGVPAAASFNEGNDRFLTRNSQVSNPAQLQRLRGEAPHCYAMSLTYRAAQSGREFRGELRKEGGAMEIAIGDPRPDCLPHHARGKPGLPPRRLDVLLQEAMRFLAGIARPGIGPGAAFVVGGAGGLAGVVAVAALEVETLVVAAEAVDRGFDRRRCAVRPRRRRARRRRSNRSARAPARCS